MLMLYSSLTIVSIAIIYAFSQWCFRKTRWVLLQPIVLTCLICILLIQFTPLKLEQFQTYTRGFEYVLSMATVALAVPLYKQLRLLMTLSWRILLPIVIGGTLAPIFSWSCVVFFDVPLALEMTILVKSITSPLAMQTADLIGGISSLAAFLVILTGLVVVIFAPLLNRLLAIEDDMAQGIAMGTVGHALATASAVNKGEICVAFASTSLCLNGLMTAFLLPILFS